MNSYWGPGQEKEVSLLESCDFTPSVLLFWSYNLYFFDKSGRRWCDQINYCGEIKLFSMALIRAFAYFNSLMNEVAGL